MSDDNPYRAEAYAFAWGVKRFGKVRFEEAIKGTRGYGSLKAQYDAFLAGWEAREAQGPEVTVRLRPRHQLKCWPEYFAPILLGKKTFELRLNDRDFQAGDILILSEWNPATGEYTGEHISYHITYVLRNVPGLSQGYAILALSEPIPGIAPWGSQPPKGKK